MSKRQQWVYFGLLSAGGFLPLLVSLLTDAPRAGWVYFVSFALLIAGIVYGAVCLWRAKRFDKLRRAGVQVAVMVATLLVLLFIYR